MHELVRLLRTCAQIIISSDTAATERRSLHPSSSTCGELPNVGCIALALASSAKLGGTLRITACWLGCLMTRVPQGERRPAQRRSTDYSACRAVPRESRRTRALHCAVRAVHLSGCASGVAVGQCASDQPIRCGEPETKRYMSERRRQIGPRRSVSRTNPLKSIGGSHKSCSCV